jgi:DNA-binding XRE family transcriptional regulator
LTAPAGGAIGAGQWVNKALANPGVRAAYEEQAPEFATARAIIAARTGAGLSQAELAARMGTSRPFVARLEGGRMLPSLRTLLKVAEATGTVPQFRLEPRHCRRQTAVRPARAAAATRYVSSRGRARGALA